MRWQKGRSARAPGSQAPGKSWRLVWGASHQRWSDGGGRGAAAPPAWTHCPGRHRRQAVASQQPAPPVCLQAGGWPRLPTVMRACPCPHHLNQAPQEGGHTLRAGHQLAILAPPAAGRAGMRKLRSTAGTYKSEATAGQGSRQPRFIAAARQQGRCALRCRAPGRFRRVRSFAGAAASTSTDRQCSLFEVSTAPPPGAPAAAVNRPHAGKPALHILPARQR